MVCGRRQVYDNKCKESNIYNHISSNSNVYGFEEYLNNVKNPTLRSNICKLRIGNNKLNYYTGTRFNTNTLCKLVIKMWKKLLNMFFCTVIITIMLDLHSYIMWKKTQTGIVLKKMTN